jgi:tetratricopeptide (TPR) repeat protein
VAKDDIDRAIADYTRAIELNPNYGPAFEARGRAYARKGDYIRAIADVTRASELAPKAAAVLLPGAVRRACRSLMPRMQAMQRTR